MRETILATCDTSFKRNEKVTAFNYFEKIEPFGHGTYIKKFSESDILSEEEMCRKVDKRHLVEYNIGTYKVMEILPGVAKISIWERFDKEFK